MTARVSNRTTTMSRWSAAVAATALAATGILAAPLAAQAVPGPPIADGIYIETPWVQPGNVVWVDFVGTTGCDDATRDWNFVATGGAVTHLSGAGFGEGYWIARGVQIPSSLGAAAPVSGNLRLTCTPTGGGASTDFLLPLTVSTTQPSTPYHSSTAWTWYTPGNATVGSVVTINALGFKPGESVTVALTNQTQYFDSANWAVSTSTPVTVTADGEGAVTGQFTVPAGWNQTDQLDAVVAGATSRYLLVTGDGTDLDGTPDITVGGTDVAFSGSAVSIAANGFEAGETVVIALHSASARAVQLGTLTANGAGSINGSVYLPTGLAAGSYRVWAGAKTIGYALLNTPLTIGPAPARDRLAGDDRYDTAVQISEQTAPFAPGQGVVYIANGLNFPDALSAGSIAAQVGGTVLLTHPDFLVDSVRDELIRLHPQTVKIVGSTLAVSAAVKTAIEGLSFTHTTERIAGADRFATNRALITDAVDDGLTVSTVYVSTGFNFPDALAAAPAAASEQGVVVLVNGNAATLDSATMDLLDDLDADQARIVGSEVAVSSSLEVQLNSYFPEHVTRYAGANRYDTAAKIVSATWPDGAPEVVLASGQNFPDALAASALGLPMLTSLPTCIPPVILAGLAELDADTLTLVGSSAALSDGVRNFAHC